MGNMILKGLMVIGYLLIVFSIVSGIGYTLYNWGSVGLELGPSAWQGFLLVLKMVGGGFVLFLVGLTGEFKVKTY